jgi:TolB-like protein/cytochrome c-type biogenesis protein CcmH/NrfG
MAMHAFGPFRLDSEAEILFRGDEALPLGRRAVALLRVLVERSGKPVSKDALIEAAWPGLAIEDSNLTVQMAAIRRVLAEEPGGDRWIETLPRRGYRFIGPQGAAQIVEKTTTPQADPAVGPRLADKPSIAVLPFTNFSGDPQQDYFADGMVEEIVTGLSRIKWLSVISRNSTSIYKNEPAPVDEVGRKFGVRYVVQGSVRKSGNRVRIGAQLIDAETGAHLWVEQYDRVLEDVFALQDEITMCVVGAIEPSLRKVEFDRIRRQRPNSFNAYDLLLQSQPLVFAGMPAEAAKAIPLLQEALTLEPDYSAAHAYMSWCMHSRFGRGGLREEDRLAAIRHARAAVRLGSDDATALAISALVLAYDGHDTATALKVFDRAIELSNCNIFVLCWSAAILAWTGKAELAIERAQLALRLGRFDPLNWRANHALSVAYFCSQRYGDAADAAQSVVDANPVYSLPRAILAGALTRLGRADDAKAMAQTVLEREPSFTIRGTARYAELDPAVFKPFADAWREAGLPE